ncbi:MAG: hypothetical protein KDA44_05840 [Planctomycetales bacterium]|nr:hypothetical protein [Planctomycetales bacterium]
MKRSHAPSAVTPAAMISCLTCATATLLAFGAPASAAPKSGNAFIPGTGTLIEYVSDDFEDESWTFTHNFPKSSREQDEQVRYPRGESSNDRWTEGPERGQPDQIQIVDAPAGALPGSKHALLLRTLHSGIPGYNSNDVQQDDLIADVIQRLGTSIPVGDRPSFTIRLYLPPFDQWEDRSGPHFGIRASASTMVTEKTGGFFSRTETNNEPYWPGMWIHFRSETSRNTKEDSAYIAVRANRRGQDYRALEISEPGWWTFGMSFTPDGMVHYYASPGVDELTAADHIASEFPYSYSALSFRTYFVDVCNQNNGRSWSTPFIIDDAKLYVMNSSRYENIVARKVQMEERRAAARAAAEERRTAAKQKQQQQRTASRRSSSER